MFITTQLCGDYFISHEIRTPSLNNQDSIESKEPGFFVAHVGGSVCKGGWGMRMVC